MATFLRLTSDLAAETPILYTKLGLFGDGVRPETKINLLLEAVDEGGRVVLAGNPRFLLRDTVRWTKTRGRVLTSERRPFPDGLNVPTFLWGGARGGIIFDIDRGNQLHFDGFAAGNAYQQPDDQRCGIVFNCDGDPAGPNDQQGGGSLLFTRLLHLTNPARDDLVIDTDPDAPENSLRGPVFIATARTSKENWEYCLFEDIRGDGQGVGTLLYFGDSFNTKHHRIKRCHATKYERAIWMRNGSLHLDECNLSANTWNLYLMGASEVCTEYKTTTENSRHHLWGNVQWTSRDGRFDPSATPVGEAWIHIGASASDVSIDGGIDRYPVPGARVFGFEPRTPRRVDLRFTVPWGMTRAQLGLDQASLDAQIGQVRFRSTPHELNPNDPGVADLASGELLHNWREPVVSSSRLTNPTPEMRTLLKGPPDLAAMAPGTEVHYIDAATGYVRSIARFPDGTYAEGPVWPYKKLKP